MNDRAKKGSLKGVKCALDGCNANAFAKTYCKPHYAQFNRTGKAVLKRTGKHGTVQERFWNFVDRGDADTCWIWQGRKDKNGYGSIRTPTTQLRAHRVSYEMHNGKIPDGLLIRHTCHNTSCVNPNHLLVGTTLDNARDKVEACRQPVNEKHANCKYPNDVVLKIRDSPLSTKELHLIYGVSESQIRNYRRKAQRQL